MIASRLDFPFVKLTEREIVDVQIPNFEDVVSECPEVFKEPNPWSALFRSIRANGFAAEVVTQLHRFSRQPDLELDQLLYLKAWLVSSRPLPEQREAIGGWLLQEMLTQVPG